VVAGRQPFRGGSCPIGKIWPTDELCRLVGKLARDYFVPVFVDFFIVVDEADDVSGSIADACVACIRRSLICLLDVD
jgi:hypothetical protein